MTGEWEVFLQGNSPSVADSQIIPVSTQLGNANNFPDTGNNYVYGDDDVIVIFSPPNVDCDRAIFRGFARFTGLAGLAGLPRLVPLFPASSPARGRAVPAPPSGAKLPRCSSPGSPAVPASPGSSSGPPRALPGFLPGFAPALQSRLHQKKARLDFARSRVLLQ